MPGDIKAFREDFDVLIKKYGWDQFFLIYGEPDDAEGKFSNLYSYGNTYSEGLISVIEDTIEMMKEKLEL